MWLRPHPPYNLYDTQIRTNSGIFQHLGLLSCRAMPCFVGWQWLSLGLLHAPRFWGPTSPSYTSSLSVVPFREAGATPYVPATRNLEKKFFFTLEDFQPCPRSRILGKHVLFYFGLGILRILENKTSTVFFKTGLNWWTWIHIPAAQISCQWLFLEYHV